MISVTKKHDFRNFVSRNQRRFECGKVPNRADRNRPKEQYYGLDNRLPNLFICLLAFSFLAYAKEQNCELECAQACGGKGNVYITNCMPPRAQTRSGRRIEVPASFVDPRGINL